MSNKKTFSVKQKNSTKAKRLITCCLSFSLLLSGCTCSNPYIKYVYEHPKFKTDYTIEEHIERISALTEENFAKELASGKLVSYNVEILYAFYDEDPEYFLIELEYAEEWKGWYVTGEVEKIEYKTKYKHTIGYILYDEYHYLTGIYNYYDFVDGRSSYRYYGYADNKKYVGFEGLQAVEKDGQIIKLFSEECISKRNDGVSPEFHIHDESSPCLLNQVVPENSYKCLMNWYGAYPVAGGKLYH